MENNLLDDLSFLDKEKPKLIYVGFVKRLFASIIDLFVVGVVVFLIAMLFRTIDALLGSNLNILLSEIVVFPIMILYAAFMESSKYQATFGKQALGIIVVGSDGRKISFIRAFARFGCKAISYIFAFIGFIMIALMPKNQGLHDMITNTFVVEDNLLSS